jgi:hypothetical protein
MDWTEDGRLVIKFLRKNYEHYAGKVQRIE